MGFLSAIAIISKIKAPEARDYRKTCENIRLFLKYHLLYQDNFLIYIAMQNVLNPLISAMILVANLHIILAR